jgi:putative redox protein
MRASVTWKGGDGVAFEGRTEDGHAIAMDGPPEFGGRGQGARPMEVVLLGTGGCAGFDVVHILKRGRHAVQGCLVELEAERAANDPKVFTRIHLHFVVTGRGLKPKDVQRAVDLSADKYCPASIMLGKTAVITHDFGIIEA